MREIKFQGYIDNPIHGKGSFRVKSINFLPLVIELDLPEGVVNFFEGEVKLRESTGLKDKNGKEIYEGDVLSAFHGTQFTLVTWNEKFGLYEIVLQLSGLSEPMEELLGNHLDVVEVIGNIYENPDLLSE